VSNTYNIKEDNSTSITGVLALRNSSIVNCRGKQERRCRSKRYNRTNAKLDWHVVLFKCFVKTNLLKIPMNGNRVSSDHFWHYALQEHT